MFIKNVGTSDFSWFDETSQTALTINAGEQLEVSEDIGTFLLGYTAKTTANGWVNDARNVSFEVV